jgi:hypothetical protein
MLFYTLATVHELNPHLFAKHNMPFLQVSNNRFFLSDTMMAWPGPAFVCACAICFFKNMLNNHFMSDTVMAWSFYYINLNCICLHMPLCFHMIFSFCSDTVMGWELFLHKLNLRLFTHAHYSFWAWNLFPFAQLQWWPGAFTTWTMNITRICLRMRIQ